eukprot:gene8533-11413_t
MVSASTATRVMMQAVLLLASLAAAADGCAGIPDSCPCPGFLQCKDNKCVKRDECVFFSSANDMGDGDGCAAAYHSDGGWQQYCGKIGGVDQGQCNNAGVGRQTCGGVQGYVFCNGNLVSSGEFCCKDCEGVPAATTTTTTTSTTTISATTTTTATTETATPTTTVTATSTTVTATPTTVTATPQTTTATTKTTTTTISKSIESTTLSTTATTDNTTNNTTTTAATAAVTSVTGTTTTTESATSTTTLSSRTTRITSTTTTVSSSTTSISRSTTTPSKPAVTTVVPAYEWVSTGKATVEVVYGRCNTDSSVNVKCDLSSVQHKVFIAPKNGYGKLMQLKGANSGIHHSGIEADVSGARGYEATLTADGTIAAVAGYLDCGSDRIASVAVDLCDKIDRSGIEEWEVCQSTPTTCKALMEPGDEWTCNIACGRSGQNFKCIGMWHEDHGCGGTRTGGCNERNDDVSADSNTGYGGGLQQRSPALAPGYIALVVISVIVILAMVVVGYCCYTRRENDRSTAVVEAVERARAYSASPGGGVTVKLDAAGYVYDFTLNAQQQQQQQQATYATPADHDDGSLRASTA